MEKFVVIDGNSLINRAFYALPPLKSLSGKSCNAVYGFVNTLLSVINKEHPKYIACVFDAGKHTFRHDLYTEYKGTRDKMPEDLASQLPLLKEVLDAMGIMHIEIPEIEADDIVGSISRKYDAEFILVSGDKDLLQLVNDNTTVWLTQRGLSDTLQVTEPVLMEQFGLKPYQVIEMKSIMGDSSDNIPGVPGIGKVGATDLIKNYQSLDNIYAHIEEIKPSIKQKLIDGKDMAYLSHTLATIKLDVDLSDDMRIYQYKLPFDLRAYEMLRELDFKSIISRRDLFGEAEVEIKATEPKQQNVEKVEIENQAQFDQMMQDLTNSVAINIDEMAFILGSRSKEYILYKTGDIFYNNIKALRELFAGDSQKICFDAKILMHELDNFNIELNNYIDISLAIYIANEMDAEITLEDACKLNNFQTDSKATILFELKEIYINQLINNLQLKLYSDIELPLVKVLYEMEKTGFSVDSNTIRSLSATYHIELEQLTNKIYELAGEQFNINSPKQLQTILFEKLNIEYKGKKSTSVEVLQEIEDQHEIVSQILRYRKIAKLISTYLDGMLNFVGLDGKIHTTFMQKTTVSGRLSSREPNLQNLPIRDDEGRTLRKMFVSSFDGGSITSADYSQIELRLIANFSNDENMINDFLSGKDIHTATASKIFNVPTSEVTTKMRRLAKSVNFGIIYGISAFGLAQNIHTSSKDAGAFIKKYMEIYPQVKEYGEKIVEQAKKDEYVSTIMGRVRHLPDINSKNHVMRSFAERTAKNMPLQGSASDIIKIAMIKVQNQLTEQNLKSKLILQIHDELVIDTYPGEEKIVAQILTDCMQNVIELRVPLLVDVSQGKTLYEAK